MVRSLECRQCSTCGRVKVLSLSICCVQEERTQNLAELERLEATVRKLTAEIALYADNDPKRMEAMSESAFAPSRSIIQTCGSLTLSCVNDRTYQGDILLFKQSRHSRGPKRHAQQKSDRLVNVEDCKSI
jgi:hypothetical protein